MLCYVCMIRLLGSSKDLDPLLDGAKLLLASRSSRDTKRHDSTRLVVLGQLQELQQTLVDFLVHPSKVLQRSSDALFGKSSPDNVLEDTSRVLGPSEEFLQSQSACSF